MKFLVSSGELQKALEIISGVVSASADESKRMAQKLEKAANGFLQDNSQYFKSTARIGGYAEDLNQRSSDYCDAVEQFLGVGMWKSFWFSGEKNMLEPIWKAAQHQIQEIVGDLLMEVFVRNEVKNFDSIVSVILKKHQWKAFAGFHALSVTSPEYRLSAVKILNTLLKGIQAQWSAFEKLEGQRPYLDSLLCLLTHMLNVVGGVLESFKESADGVSTAGAPKGKDTDAAQNSRDYHAWVFSSRKAFEKFSAIHRDFCNSISDIAFLYRKFFEERLIIIGMSRFQEWYNHWHACKKECWNQFKTMNRLAVPKRLQLYEMMLQKYLDAA